MPRFMAIVRATKESEAGVMPSERMLAEMGRFNEAREAYEMALKIDNGNSFIRANYEQFREIYDRQNRRRGR